MIGYDIQQSTTNYPLLFLLILTSDHISPATGLTPTVTLSKNGAAFTSPAGAVTEIGNGWYKVAGNATDTSTLGPLALHATVATADPADAMYPVVAVNPQSTAYGLVLAKTSNITGFNDIAATTVVSAGAITTSGGAVSTVTTVGTLTTYTGNTVQTGDSFGRIGALGAGLTALAPSSTALSTATWTATLAGYVSNLNVGGNVASHADAVAIEAAVGSPLQASAYAAAPTPAQIATGVWTDTTAGDFTVSGSPGQTIVQLDGTFTTSSSSIFSAAAMVNALGITLSTPLNAARALDAIADTSFTLNDALQCAVAGIAAQVDASSGTTCVWKTSSTGTTLRTKTLTLVSPPSTVPDKAV
jgi:hypothetical protein